jgi:uncharacterized protein with HEPN domain
MALKRDYVEYLRDILDYATRAEQFVAGLSYAEFATDQKTQSAVLHAITIIGEAANRIPSQIQTQYTAIPWRDIINMRHRLIHGYDVVLLHLVWGVIQADLPPLKAQIAAILEDIEGTE